MQLNLFWDVVRLQYQSCARRFSSTLYVIFVSQRYTSWFPYPNVIFVSLRNMSRFPYTTCCGFRNLPVIFVSLRCTSWFPYATHCCLRTLHWRNICFPTLRVVVPLRYTSWFPYATRRGSPTLHLVVSLRYTSWFPYATRRGLLTLHVLISVRYQRDRTMHKVIAPKPISVQDGTACSRAGFD